MIRKVCFAAFGLGATMFSALNFPALAANSSAPETGYESCNTFLTDVQFNSQGTPSLKKNELGTIEGLPKDHPAYYKVTRASGTLMIYLGDQGRSSILQNRRDFTLDPKVPENRKDVWEGEEIRLAYTAGGACRVKSTGKYTFNKQKKEVYYPEFDANTCLDLMDFYDKCHMRQELGNPCTTSEVTPRVLEIFKKDVGGIDKMYVPRAESAFPNPAAKAAYIVNEQCSSTSAAGDSDADILKRMTAAARREVINQVRYDRTDKVQVGAGPPAPADDDVSTSHGAGP